MKKSTPDHRPQVFDSEHHIPTEIEAQELAREFQFSSDFDLREHLECAYMLEETARHVKESEHPVSSVRQMLTAVDRSCTDLRELICNLGSDERSRLIDSMLENRKISLSDLERDLKNLGSASGVALNTMEGERDFRGKKENIWVFVSRLADIWQQGTKEQPTAGYSDEFEPGHYVGAFYHFVKRVFALGNVDISDGDPGSTIVRVLKEWKTNQNTSDTVA